MLALKDLASLPDRFGIPEQVFEPVCPYDDGKLEGNSKFVAGLAGGVRR